ncbi:MAG: alpha/beta hydrolase, partial [Muribaculaceae bacterium]|nr:alpha/beta hydrolase [Muribaculaceae bacterium]
RAGAVRSTIIRREVPSARTGVLYIHGFNDYFFQANMGDFFVNNGLSFYAVDLRKYGRSLMAGQRRYQAHDLSEYFPDIDSTITVMRQQGIRDIVLIGHSTGGLIATYYIYKRQPSVVKGLILNSPFLDWNLSGLQEKVLVPMVDCLASPLPSLNIPQGSSTAYSQSLLAGEHGRWSYDTNKKLSVSPPVEASWIRAIDRAQAEVQRGNVVKIPILLMHSDNTVEGSEWSEAFNHGDCVLDVTDISRYGRRLGPSVTEATVKGGLHDLVLSEPQVEAAVLQSMLRFIRRLGLIPTPR